MSTTWQNLKKQVTELADLIWKCKFQPDRIDGVNFDAVGRPSEEESVLIDVTQEHTLDKIRQSVGRLSPIRHKFLLDNILAKCFIVMREAPTQGMKDFAAGQKIKVVSADEFISLAFPFRQYLLARGTRSFGSTVSGVSSEADLFRYVPVSYLRRSPQRAASLNDLTKSLLQRNRIVLLGDFGTGKSRCVKELFFELAEDATHNLLFPLAINLREHWGAESAIEIISGHLNRCGLILMSAQDEPIYGML